MTKTIDFDALVRKASDTKITDRIVLYGVEGSGKTSFAARFPGAFGIMVDTEDGLEVLVQRGKAPDVPHTPLVTDWTDLRLWLEHLRHGSHETIFIDALTGVEQLAIREVLRKSYRWNGDEERMHKCMEEFMAYGKGWGPTKALWHNFLMDVQAIRDAGKTVILIGHADVVKHKNPKGTDYVRYQARLQNDIWARTREWGDMVLFFDFLDTVVDENEFFKIGKGKGGRQRVCHTERSAAFDAKNRHGLPVTITLGKDADEAYTAVSTLLEK